MRFNVGALTIVLERFKADGLLRASAVAAFCIAAAVPALLLLAGGWVATALSHRNGAEDFAARFEGFFSQDAAGVLFSASAANVVSFETGLLSAAVLFLAAWALLAEFCGSLTHLWEQDTPHRGIRTAKVRFVSPAASLVAGFLLLASGVFKLATSAVLALLAQFFPLPGWAIHFAGWLCMLLAAFGLFLLLIEQFSGMDLPCRRVAPAAAGSATFFCLSYFLLGALLPLRPDTPLPGLAYSTVLFLLYAFCVSCLLFLGAEASRLSTLQPERAILGRIRQKPWPREGQVSEQPSPSSKPLRAPGRGKPLWHKLLLHASVFLPALGLLLVSARVALPFFVRGYVNQTLRDVSGFQGSIGSIRINLFRGAYTIENLTLAKKNAQVREPFLVVPEIDLSIEWAQLLRGALVGEVILNRPRISFENGPSQRQKQTGIHTSWQSALEDMFPFTINRFEVNDGFIRYSDPYTSPPVDISVQHLYATATNLTNVRAKGTLLPAGLVASANTTGNGKLRLSMLMNPLADQPAFKLVASVTNLALPALNDFIRSYGNFDVQSGTFSLYVDIAAANGSYNGHLKPFFFNLRIFTWNEATRQDLLQDFWEAIIGGASQLIRNQRYDQLATTIPVSGKFPTALQPDLWQVVSGFLRNAFIRALLPKITRPTVPLPQRQHTASHASSHTSFPPRYGWRAPPFFTAFSASHWSPFSGCGGFCAALAPDARLNVAHIGKWSDPM